MVDQAQKAAITTRALFLLEQTSFNHEVTNVTLKIGSILSQCYKVGE